MKKVVFAFLSVCALGDCRSETVEKSAVKPVGERRPKTGAEAFNGFYAGIGAGYSSSRNTVTNLEHSLSWSDPNGKDLGGNIQISDVSTDLVRQHINMQFVDSRYAGRMLYSFRASSPKKLEMLVGKPRKSGGAFSCGYGKFMETGIFKNPLYLGVDLSVDFSGNKKVSGTDPLTKDLSSFNIGYGTITQEITGIVPSVALRVGMAAGDSLLYLRLGGAYMKADVSCSKAFAGADKVKLRSLAPMVGIGLEKNMSFCSLRLECDLRFPTEETDYFKKEMDLTIGTALPRQVIISSIHSSKIRLKSCGYTVRVLFVRYL